MKKLLIIISIILLLASYGSIVVLSKDTTREISRSGDYKLMEKDVSENGQVTRKVTFELPVEWDNSGGSVMGLVGDDGNYRLKFDLWDIISTTRESVMNENNERNGEFIDYITEENTYETENYEIFYYKTTGGMASAIRSYYLYANGERFAVTGYVFGEEDKPEYDDIFNRIAESIKFQFDVNEDTPAPQTNDYIFIYLIALSSISIILIRYCKYCKYCKKRRTA